MTIDENRLTDPNSERLKELLQSLSTLQIRFVIARAETKTDKEACELIDLSTATPRNWPNKADVDETVKLMAYDGVITALELRRRALARAMAVKVSGLENTNDKIKQDAATEIIEWELGKAAQINKNENVTTLRVEGIA